MSTVTVVARVVARKESVAGLKSELLKLVAPTRNETGCREYRLHQDRDEPGVFIFYENWESMASLEKHRESAHFKQYVNATAGMIADKVVHVLNQIA